jgi:RNA polymerase sigma-70 factor (ECF subfamily)
MSEISDDDLILNYRASLKSEIITEIFLRYSDKVYRMALQMSGNPADAEDAMQSSFIKCIEHLHQYQIGSNFKAWLMRIVINTCKHKFNEEKSRSNRELKFSNQKDKLQMDETLADNEELQNKIKNCVKQLPEKYSAPIWLVLYEGFSYPEAASSLSLPEKTVRTQVSRGLEKLRTTLASLGIFKSIEIISVLISSSKLEVAPSSAIKIIKSIQLKQSLGKVSGVASKESNRLLSVGLNSTSLISKVLLFTLLGSFIVVSGFYFFNFDMVKKYELNEVSNKEVKSPQIIPKIEYTNHTWSFFDKEDAGIKLLEGTWEWSSLYKGMVTPFDVDIAVALPIKAQDKVFQIELDIIAEPTKKNPKISVDFGVKWERKDRVLKHESFIFSSTFKPSVLRPKVKIYFYQQYIFTFTNNEYDALAICHEDLKDAFPVISAKNFIFKKIKSTTLETPPAEIITAIQMSKKLSNGTFNKSKPSQ